MEMLEMLNHWQRKRNWINNSESFLTHAGKMKWKSLGTRWKQIKRGKYKSLTVPVWISHKLIKNIEACKIRPTWSQGEVTTFFLSLVRTMRMDKGLPLIQLGLLTTSSSRIKKVYSINLAYQNLIHLRHLQNWLGCLRILNCQVQHTV